MWLYSFYIPATTEIKLFIFILLFLNKVINALQFWSKSKSIKLYSTEDPSQVGQNLCKTKMFFMRSFIILSIIFLAASLQKSKNKNSVWKLIETETGNIFRVHLVTSFKHIWNKLSKSEQLEDQIKISKLHKETS